MEDETAGSLPRLALPYVGPMRLRLEIRVRSAGVQPYLRQCPVWIAGCENRPNCLWAILAVGVRAGCVVKERAAGVSVEFLGVDKDYHPLH